MGLEGGTFSGRGVALCGDLAHRVVSWPPGAVSGRVLGCVLVGLLIGVIGPLGFRSPVVEGFGGLCSSWV